MMVSIFDVAVSLRKFISTEVRRRHGAESLVGGVEDCRLSFCLPPLSPGSSWISGRDPLLVVLYCNSPDFTKIEFFCFWCELFDCLICLWCLHPRFIDRRLFFPLLSRTGRRPTLATPTLDLCDIGFHPITLAKTARDQPKPTERKTPFNK